MRDAGSDSIPRTRTATDDSIEQEPGWTMDTPDTKPVEEQTSPPEDSAEVAGEGTTGEKAEKWLIAETAIELAGLARQWVSLTLEDAWLRARAALARSAFLIALGLLGGMLLLGGLIFLDLILYRWIAVALASGNWALFVLAMGHFAIGGLLLRYCLGQLRGRHEA